MLTQMQIVTALENRALEFAEARGLKCAVDNVKIDPPASSVWLECYVIPADTAAVSLDGALVSDLGIMQISVYYPKDTGSTAVRQIVDALIAFFPHNSAIIAQGEKIWLDEPTTAGRAFDGMIPVTVNYSYVGASGA